MRKLIPFLLVAMATVFIVSCKSTSTGPTVAYNSNGNNNGGDNTPGDHGIDPNGNVWLNPPATGDGIQIKIMPFYVPKDSEIQGDFFFDFPSNVDFEIGRIQIA